MSDMEELLAADDAGEPTQSPSANVPSPSMGPPPAAAPLPQQAAQTAQQPAPAPAAAAPMAPAPGALVPAAPAAQAQQQPQQQPAPGQAGVLPPMNTQVEVNGGESQFQAPAHQPVDPGVAHQQHTQQAYQQPAEQQLQPQQPQQPQQQAQGEPDLLAAMNGQVVTGEQQLPAMPGQADVQPQQPQQPQAPAQQQPPQQQPQQAPQAQQWQQAQQPPVQQQTNHPLPVTPPWQPQDQANQEAVRYAMLEQRIEAEYAQFAHAVGLYVLADPSHRNPQNRMHEVIYYMHWEPHSLQAMDPNRLNQFETVLSSNQLYVQSLENHWSQRYRTLAKEFERAIFVRRRNFDGGTKGEQEAACFAAEPDMEHLRTELALAQAMANRLEGMGERFAQYEDGLKRTINFATEEWRHQHFNRSA